MKREKNHLSLPLLRRIFAKKNTVCALCGKPTGKNRYQVGKTNSGALVWLCFHCASRNYRNQVKIDPETGAVEVFSPRGTPIVPAAPGKDREAPIQEAAPEAAPEAARKPAPEPVRTVMPAEESTVIHVAVPEDSDSSDAAGSPMLLADELQKYKDKLDSGTITEEEFYALKWKLLGME